MANWDAEIAEINWEACLTCAHSDAYCNCLKYPDGHIAIELDIQHEFVACLGYEKDVEK